MNDIRMTMQKRWQFHYNTETTRLLDQHYPDYARASVGGAPTFLSFSFWLLHLLSLVITLRQQEILHNPSESVHITLKQMPVTQRDEFCVLQYGLECWANIFGQRALELLMCRRSETKATFCTLLLPLRKRLVCPPSYLACVVVSYVHILLVLLTVAWLWRVRWRRRRGLEFLSSA